MEFIVINRSFLFDLDFLCFIIFSPDNPCIYLSVNTNIFSIPTLLQACLKTF